MEARVEGKMLYGTGFGRFGARILRPATGRNLVAVYAEEEARAFNRGFTRHTITSIPVNDCTAQLIAQVDTGPSILSRRNRRRELLRAYEGGAAGWRGGGQDGRESVVARKHYR